MAKTDVRGEIDVQAEIAKYQAELETFAAELRKLDDQRAILIQAIHQRQGILGYLSSLNQHEEQSDGRNGEALVDKQNNLG